MSFQIADRIDALLKQKGISQKELAKLTQTSEAAVSRWLSDTHNFTLSTLAKISAVLGQNIIVVDSMCYRQQERMNEVMEDRAKNEE